MSYFKPHWRNLIYFISFLLIATLFPIVPAFDFSNCEPECQGLECISCQDWELKFVNLADSLSYLNLNFLILLLELITFYLISCFFVWLYMPDKMDE